MSGGTLETGFDPRDPAARAALADWCDAWLTEAALPLWADRGRDADGAFYEALDLDGAPLTDRVRRVRVQFRQIFVYAAAALHGLRPDGGQIALKAFETVRARAWAPDGAPGWAHLLGPDGSVVDATRDAYDQAFALMGLSWLWRATGDARARAAIDETIAFVDDGLAAASGGWWEAAASDETGAGGPSLRRQNPHMHALEAMLALYEAFGDRAYLDRARQVYHLFAGRFYDWPKSVVLEYFDMDWRPAPPNRQRVEPGHLAEWVLLIRDYERLTGENVGMIAEPLYARAREIGLDPTGRFLLDELDMSGRPTKATRRLWPQTELTRAGLAQYRATGSETALAEGAAALWALKVDYLSAGAAGGWRDAFDLSGQFIAEDMPASSFYHVFGAMALARDILRRRPARRRALEPSPKEAADMTKAATDRQITPVILAGGAGSRLWPLSTPETPKQFLRLVGRRTLFQETLARVGDPALFGPAVVVAAEAHAERIAAEAAEIGATLRLVIAEPEGRNSAPALAAAAYVCAPEELLLALPADHLIRETALFHGIVETARAAAELGSIVTFGVTPTRPETAFGYIRAGAPLGKAGAFEVDAFVEKPDLATARGYVASGSYLWNSGMFLFRASELREELTQHAPEVARAAAAAANGADRSALGGGDAQIARLSREAFGSAPSISIDYAVMEKTDRAAVCPAALTWSDIGSWDSLADAHDSDADGNHAEGAAALLDCARVFVRTDGVQIAAIGLEDVVVIAAGDTVLVADRASAQKVKEAAALLAAKSVDDPSKDGS